MCIRDRYEAVGRTVYNDLTDGKSDLTVWFDGVETPVKTADVEDYVCLLYTSRCV